MPSRNEAAPSVPAPMTVIWNPSAGSEARNAEALEVFSHRREFQIRLTESADDVRRYVEQAIEDGASRIIAAGGDGTVHGVAELLLQSSADVEFGVFPLGTGNDLARSLGMPLEPTEAVEALRTGLAVSIDVMVFAAEGREHFAVNMLTGGNTGKFMEGLTDEMKQRWGPFCYLRGAIDVLQDLDVYPIELACDGGAPERIDAINVFLANGPATGGGLSLSPEARLNDGTIDVIVVKDGPPLEIAQLTAQYVVSDFRQHELIRFQQAREVSLQCSTRMPGSADGDVLEWFPEQVTIRPRALRTVVGPLEAAVVKGGG